MTKIGHTISIFHQIECAAHGESLLDCETKIWSQSDGSNERPRPLTSLRQFFQVTERLITDHDQKLLDWPRLTGSSSCGARRLCLLTELFSLQLPKPSSFVTQCYVWEVSVTNQSKPGKAGSNGFWTRYLKDVDRIDGEPMEFEWKNFPGFTTLGILGEVQKMMTKSKCEPELSKGRIIFMSMYNDIDWTRRGNKDNCIANALRVTEYARRFTQGHLVVSGSWIREEMVREPMATNWMENGTELLKALCSTLPKADILCFVPAASWKEENWKAKWKPFTSTEVMKPFNWFFAQLFPSISSVSAEQKQICVKNEPETHQVQGNPPQMRIWNRRWYRPNFLLLTLFLRLMRKYNESCCVNTSRNSQNFLNNRNWPNSAPTVVFRRKLTKDNSSLHWMKKDLTIWKHNVESTPHFEVRKHPACEGGFVATRRSAQSWMWRSAIIRDVTVLRSWSNL